MDNGRAAAARESPAESIYLRARLTGRLLTIRASRLAQLLAQLPLRTHPVLERTAFQPALLLVDFLRARGYFLLGGTIGSLGQHRVFSERLRNGQETLHAIGVSQMVLPMMPIPPGNLG